MINKLVGYWNQLTSREHCIIQLMFAASLFIILMVIAHYNPGGYVDAYLLGGSSN